MTAASEIPVPYPRETLPAFGTANASHRIGGDQVVRRPGWSLLPHSGVTQ